MKIIFDIISHRKSMKKIAILISIICFTNNIFSQSDTFDTLFSQAKSFVDAKDDENAKIYFEKAIRLSNDCAECYAYLSKFEYKNDINKAKDLVMLAKKANPELWLSYYVNALIYRENKQLDIAISEFGRALYFAKNNVDCLFERGITYMQKRDIDAAISDFKTVLTIEQDNPEIEYLMAFAYLQKKDFRNAEIAINKAIIHDSTTADFFNLQFTIMEQQKKYYEAEMALLNSLKINPTDFNVYINLGDLYFITGNYDVFCERYNYALTLMTTKDKAQFPDIQEKTDKYCNKNSGAYYYLLAQSAQLNKKYEDALELANKGLEFAKESPILYDVKSLALLCLQRLPEVETAINNAINYKNNLQSDIKNYFAIEVSPQQIQSMQVSYLAKFYLQLGCVQTMKKEYEKSILSMKFALSIAKTEKNFTGTEYFYLLNMLNYLASGDKAQAEIEMNTAYKMNTRNPVCALYTAYCALFLACDYSVKDFSFEYVEDMKIPRIILPKLTLNSAQLAKLQETLTISNNLIQKFPQNPFPFLLRAKVNSLLLQPNFCQDAHVATELGVKNVYEELGVKCE